MFMPFTNQFSRTRMRSCMPLLTVLFVTCLMYVLTPVHGQDEKNVKAQKTILEEATRFFQKGNNLVGEQPKVARTHYEKALRRYKQLVDHYEVKNGRLFYNIGNVYFRLNDIGHAILYYRRAQELIEGDPNLQRNLTYARKTRQDAFEQTEKDKVLETLLFFHYDLPIAWRAWMFAVAWIIFWVAMILRVSARNHGKRGRIPASIPIVSLIVALVFLILMAIDQYHYTTTREGVIIANEVTTRKGDSVSYKPAFDAPLHAGTEFVQLEKRGSWLQVRLPDERTCWLPGDTVKMIR